MQYMKQTDGRSLSLKIAELKGARRNLYDYKANVFPHTLYLYRNFGMHPLIEPATVLTIKHCFHHTLEK